MDSATIALLTSGATLAVVAVGWAVVYRLDKHRARKEREYDLKVSVYGDILRRLDRLRELVHALDAIHQVDTSPSKNAKTSVYLLAGNTFAMLERVPTMAVLAELNPASPDDTDLEDDESPPEASEDEEYAAVAQRLKQALMREVMIAIMDEARQLQQVARTVDMVEVQPETSDAIREANRLIGERLANIGTTLLLAEAGMHGVLPMNSAPAWIQQVNQQLNVALLAMKKELQRIL